MKTISRATKSRLDMTKLLTTSIQKSLSNFEKVSFEIVDGKKGKQAAKIQAV